MTTRPRIVMPLLLSLCALEQTVLIGSAKAQLASYPTLHLFALSEGAAPIGRLLQASDGSIYGTTQGGQSNLGTVFRITLAGSFSKVYQFTGAGDGSNPSAGLVEGTAGSFYGVAEDTSDLNFTMTAYSVSSAGVFKVIHTFSNSNLDLQNPLGELVYASNGVLYGTTQAGGSYNGGTVFGLTTDGSDFAIHYNFNGAVGLNPMGPLISPYNSTGQVTLYGTTRDQGTLPDGTRGKGTVFALGISKIVGQTDEFATLHVFDGSDGSAPRFGVERAGTVTYGVCPSGGAYGYGTLFRLATDGTLTTLHDFTGGLDGAGPNRVIHASDGNLYGTTAAGGAGTTGVVFRTASDGSNFTVLHSFANGNGTTVNLDGANPQGLIQASDGNLYGTTCFGGSSSYGTVFVIDLTPPAVTALCSPSQAKASKKTKTVTISGSVSDSLSGPDLSSGSYVVQDSAGGSTGGGFTISSTGAYSFKLNLSTSTPAGTTRTYTITVHAKDKQGNAGSAVTTLTVNG